MSTKCSCKEVDKEFAKYVFGQEVVTSKIENEPIQDTVIKTIYCLMDLLKFSDGRSSDTMSRVIKDAERTLEEAISWLNACFDDGIEDEDAGYDECND